MTVLGKGNDRWLLALMSLGFAHAVFAAPVTLHQAEAVALSRASEIKMFGAKHSAFEERSIAASQLNDPKLVLNAQNVPTDSFSFTQDPMTQLQVGIWQQFSRGHSRHYQSLVLHELAKSELESQQNKREEILRMVRLSWINLYYWIKAKRIVLQQKRVFSHLIKINESMLANNKAQQKDVIRARLELSELTSQLINIDEGIDQARIDLARWAGRSIARQAKPHALPRWKNPPALLKLQQTILHHPQLRSAQAVVVSKRAKVMLARQQYKPDLAVGVTYGFRQGSSRNFQPPRSNLLTANLAIGLPIFPRNRQARGVAASLAGVTVAQQQELTRLRDLNESLKTQYVLWRQLGRQSWVYRRYLVPESKQYTESTLISYQNGQTDFPTLARSYILELKTKLDRLNIMVQRARARANLLYLQGT